MNRSELVAAIAKRVDLSVELVDEIFGATIEELTLALARGETVTIRSFGVLEPRSRRSSQRYDFNAGALKPVPATTTVGFRPAEPLKRRLNPPTLRRRTT